MSAPVLRATSTYTVEVATHIPSKVCDLLIQQCPARLAASGVDFMRAFVRFRAENDAVAINVARQTAGNLPYILHTGYGVNQRTVRTVHTNSSGTEDQS